jgi:hypothetical protein
MLVPVESAAVNNGGKLTNANGQCYIALDKERQERR